MNENIRARLEMQMSGIGHDVGVISLGGPIFVRPLDVDCIMAIIEDEQEKAAGLIIRLAEGIYE